MGLQTTTNAQGRTIASIDSVTECAQSHTHGFSWLILRDDAGNEVRLFMSALQVRRLHETFAATATPVDASDLARTVA